MLTNICLILCVCITVIQASPPDPDLPEGSSRPPSQPHYVPPFHQSQPLDLNIDTGRIFWIQDDDSVDEFGEGHHGMTAEMWMEKMKKPGVFADNVFVQLSAICLNRDIVVVPVFSESASIDGKFSIYKASGDGPYRKSPPLYVLYYESWRFEGAHYDSIRPSNNGIPNAVMEYIMDQSCESSGREPLRMTLTRTGNRLWSIGSEDGVLSSTRNDNPAKEIVAPMVIQRNNNSWSVRNSNTVDSSSATEPIENSSLSNKIRKATEAVYADYTNSSISSRSNGLDVSNILSTKTRSKKQTQNRIYATPLICNTKDEKCKIHTVQYGKHFDPSDWHNSVESMAVPSGICPACEELIPGRRGIKKEVVMRHHLFIICSKYPHSKNYSA